MSSPRTGACSERDRTRANKRKKESAITGTDAMHWAQVEGGDPVCEECLKNDDDIEYWYCDEFERFDPAHCSRCNEFLENELDTDGARHVLEQWEYYKARCEEVDAHLKEWLKFYGIEYLRTKADEPLSGALHDAMERTMLAALAQLR